MSKILLVDDDKAERARIRNALIKEGHEVFEANNGKDGLLALLADRQFDFLIADIMMPVMDGLELIHHARVRNPHLGIIAMSDCAAPRNLTLFDAAAELGANASIEKKNLPDLLELIATREGAA